MYRPSDEDVAELRRQQAQFKEGERAVSRENAWMAVPALAPVAAVLGVEAAGAIAARLAPAVVERLPLQLAERDPYLRVGGNWATRAGRRAHKSLEDTIESKGGGWGQGGQTLSGRDTAEGARHLLQSQGLHMSRKSYATALDEVLMPMGFTRDGVWWSRTVGTVLEQIDLQTSNVAGTTANLRTKDLATEELLCEAIPWKRPMEIVRFGMRIGTLMRGKDKWWRNDPNGPSELAEAIRTHADRYFESRRSLEDQARYFGRQSDRFGPASIRIYLALTLYRMGEIDEALRALENPPKTMTPSWRPQVESAREWLLAKLPATTP